MIKLVKLAMPAIVTLAAACSSSSSTDRATLGTLTYEVPSGWVSKDLSRSPRAMVQWTPSDNERKESVTIARVERAAPTRFKANDLVRLLDDAQKNLLGGKFDTPTRFTTKSGFDGVRIEGSFTPPGRKQPYHRIHAVVVDGSSILTVIYTAHEPDREAFETVIESIQSNRGA